MCPVGTIRYCYDRMTPDLCREYLNIAPWAMMALYHQYFSKEDRDAYLHHLTEMTLREFQERKTECPEIILYTKLRLSRSDDKWCYRRIQSLKE